MVNNHDQQDIFSVLEKGKQWIENDTCNITHCLKITQKCLIFLKLAKLTIFGIFSQLLSSLNVNVARFARKLEWDFFCDFQIACIIGRQK